MDACCKVQAIDQSSPRIFSIICWRAMNLIKIYINLYVNSIYFYINFTCFYISWHANSIIRYLSLSPCYIYSYLLYKFTL